MAHTCTRESTDCELSGDGHHDRNRAGSLCRPAPVAYCTSWVSTVIHDRVTECMWSMYLCRQHENGLAQRDDGGTQWVVPGTVTACTELQ
jgi:hypothetical protein